MGKQGKACLVTLVDRKSRYLMCGKADKKNAQAVSRAMVDLLLGAKALSVTPDRGKEFARHSDVTEYLGGACHSIFRNLTSRGKGALTRILMVCLENISLRARILQKFLMTTYKEKLL